MGSWFFCSRTTATMRKLTNFNTDHVYFLYTCRAALSSAYCTLFWLLRTLPLLKASLPQCQRSELCMRERHSLFAV